MSSLPLFVETRAHILLCTGPSCRRVGAVELFAGAWHDLERERLAYYCAGGSLRLTESGCLGACASGPNLAVYHAHEGRLAQAWYSHVDRKKTLAIARALHEDAPLPTDGRFDRGEP